MNFIQEELFLLKQVYKKDMEKEYLILNLKSIEVNEEDFYFFI